MAVRFLPAVLVAAVIVVVGVAASLIGVFVIGGEGDASIAPTIASPPSLPPDVGPTISKAPAKPIGMEGESASGTLLPQSTVNPVAVPTPEDAPVIIQYSYEPTSKGDAVLQPITEPVTSPTARDPAPTVQPSNMGADTLSPEENGPTYTTREEAKPLPPTAFVCPLSSSTTSNNQNPGTSSNIFDNNTPPSMAPTRTRTNFDYSRLRMAHFQGTPTNPHPRTYAAFQPSVNTPIVISVYDVCTQTWWPHKILPSKDIPTYSMEALAVSRDGHHVFVGLRNVAYGLDLRPDANNNKLDDWKFLLRAGAGIAGFDTLLADDVVLIHHKSTTQRAAGFTAVSFTTTTNVLDTYDAWGPGSHVLNLAQHQQLILTGSCEGERAIEYRFQSSNIGSDVLVFGNSTERPPVFCTDKYNMPDDQMVGGGYVYPKLPSRTWVSSTEDLVINDLGRVLAADDTTKTIGTLQHNNATLGILPRHRIADVLWVTAENGESYIMVLDEYYGQPSLLILFDNRAPFRYRGILVVERAERFGLSVRVDPLRVGRILLFAFDRTAPEATNYQVVESVALKDFVLDDDQPATTSAPTRAPQPADPSIPTEWTLEAHAQDVSYFYVPRLPLQLERYHLARQEWMAPIPLEETRGRVTGLGVVGEGVVYVAFGRAVYRYEIDADSTTIRKMKLYNSGTRVVTRIHQDGDLLLFGEGLVVTYSLTTQQELDLQYSRLAALSRQRNRIVSASTYVDSRDDLVQPFYSNLEYYNPLNNNNGTLGKPVVPRGFFDMREDSEVWVSPDGTYIVDDLGTIYSLDGPNDVPLASLTSKFSSISDSTRWIRSLDWLEMDGKLVIVALEFKSSPSFGPEELVLTLFDTFSFVPLGSQRLDDAGAKTVRAAGNGLVVTFSHNESSANGILVNATDITNFRLRYDNSSDLAVNEPGSFHVYDTFVDRDGIFNMILLAQKRILRWDASLQSFLEPVPILLGDYTQDIQSVTYSNVTHAVYVVGKAKLIVRIGLPTSETNPDTLESMQQPFKGLEVRAYGLLATEDHLIATHYWGQYAFHWNGTRSAVDMIPRWTRARAWDPSQRKVYVIDQNNRLISQQVDQNGGFGRLGYSPYGTHVGNRILAIHPNGFAVVTDRGSVFDAESLELLPSRVAYNLLDAEFIRNEEGSFDLLTVRQKDKSMNFELWEGPSYSQFKTELMLPGNRAKLTAGLGHDSIFVAVTSWAEQRVPNIYVLDGALGVVASLTDENVALCDPSEQGWYLPLFASQRDPAMTTLEGLQGEENRHRLAETFKRPTTWQQYCELVSSTNCAVADQSAMRPPQGEDEASSYFAEGLYEGHFRYTEDNDCDKHPDTCTGHFASFNCGWWSSFGQQSSELGIFLQSDGPEANGGYTVQHITQMWHASNATKSPIMTLWGTPNPFSAGIVGTDMEMVKVILPD